MTERGYEDLGEEVRRREAEMPEMKFIPNTIHRRYKIYHKKCYKTLLRDRRRYKHIIDLSHNWLLSA